MSDKSPPATVVGIDLGTTFSAIARMDEYGRVDVIPNIDGFTTTPSVVFFDDDSVLVGREAVKALLVEPRRGAECFKRDIGMPVYNSPVNGEEMRPERLSAIVLAKLKQDAEEIIGPIRDAVITVPAFFDDGRRKATEDAGQIAGLNVLKVINEPTAAAIWYGFEGDAARRKGDIFMVYDLGGGTFDATLMRVVNDYEFETIATDGEVVLGGKDWDERLLNYVVEQFQEETGLDPREDETSHQELVQRVEECKRTLSKRTSASISVTYGGQRLRIPVSRAQFEELTVDLLARTQMMVELVVDEAGLTWDQISTTILVGGSSHMPMVSRMLQSVTGRPPETRGEFELAVARGAAVYASALVGSPSAVSGAKRAPTVRDVNSHSLGVEVEDDDGRSRNFVVIPKNSQIPCNVSQQFGLATESSAGSKIRIGILEGEAPDPEACIRIGECVISGLPQGLPAGSPVEVTFSYSEDGRIQVQAEALAAHLQARTEIQRRNALTDDALHQEAKVVTKLRVL